MPSQHKSDALNYPATARLRSGGDEGQEERKLGKNRERRMAKRRDGERKEGKIEQRGREAGKMPRSFTAQRHRDLQRIYYLSALHKRCSPPIKDAGWRTEGGGEGETER